MVKVLLPYGINSNPRFGSCFDDNTLFEIKDPKFTNMNPSLLHIVCHKGFSTILKLLLKQPSISVNVRDNCDNTPLHVAAKEGNLYIVELLLQHKNIRINATNIRRETPFHLTLRFATEHDDCALAKLFLSYSTVNVNAQTYVPDETPIVYAILSEFTEVVELLLKRSDINLDIQYKKEALLELAMSFGHDEITKLIQDKVESNKTTEKTISPSQIRELLQTRTKKNDNTPRVIIVRGYHYVFANYKNAGIRYLCLNGANYHKEQARRCTAEILVPYEIIFEANAAKVYAYNNVAVQVINQHTCSTHSTIQTGLAIDETELKSKIAEVYQSGNVKGKHAVYVKVCDDLRQCYKNAINAPKLPYELFSKLYNSIDNQAKPEKEKEIKTKRGDPFELFNVTIRNSENQKQKIICFSSNFQLSLIPHTQLVGIDGTFRIAPQNFAQLWVIMAKTKKLNVPIAYILLPDKKESTYINALTLFQANMKSKQFPPGTTFTMDFEHAEINAVNAIFKKEGQFIQLCYYHFSNSLVRWFHIWPKTTTNKQLFKLALLFPFISHDTVFQVIAELKTFARTQLFAKKFERVYLKEFPIQYWNTTGKPEQSRVTNNIPKSHNRKLTNRLNGTSHPSLATFKEIITDLEDEYALLYHNQQEVDGTVIKHYSEENDFEPAYRDFILRLRKIENQPDQRNDSETDEDPLDPGTNQQQNDILDHPYPQAPPLRLTYKNFPPLAQQYIQNQRELFVQSATKDEKSAIADTTSRELLKRFDIEFSSSKVRAWFHAPSRKKMPAD